MAGVYSAGGINITVDQVREQLEALGHADVPDDIISGFLKDLEKEGLEQFEVPGLEQQAPEVQRGDFPSSRDSPGHTTETAGFDRHDYSEGYYAAGPRNEQRHVDRYDRVDSARDSYEQSGARARTYEEEEEREEAFREQTYAAHGYELGGRTGGQRLKSAKAATQRPASAGPRTSNKFSLQERDISEPLWEDERENFDNSSDRKTVPSLNFGADGMKGIRRPQSAGPQTARPALASRNGPPIRNSTHGALSARSTYSSMSASRCGSIVVQPKPKEKKIDRVARYAQMQQSWKNDSFLTAKAKPRPAQNFHAIHAAQHAAHAQQTAIARANGTMRKKETKFVAPNEKRRDNLRWEVRVRLLNGQDGRVP
mmetsp:Transcript_34054/g.41183  ORF Transcript_34054/g.41183 Transcript_34054/m.41183 type:complete len:369 (-) Transcript_34054:290-1396(-)|eukprot:CAMPEP_0197854082 /NCGR_PEP_ID=MMETSP1438-20131217/24004_1 /TAXON_ID=1461541 /ORGANISM="Pterosperma sp., Strain CCMP1384" /LENGTH=368 /DNA_ID=CAMNT_0043468719 /DNA_START=143 /DNA_END=1249 /DNA_ORIENTATION=-